MQASAHKAEVYRLLISLSRSKRQLTFPLVELNGMSSEKSAKPKNNNKVTSDNTVKIKACYIIFSKRRKIVLVAVTKSNQMNESRFFRKEPIEWTHGLRKKVLHAL